MEGECVCCGREERSLDKNIVPDGDGKFICIECATNWIAKLRVELATEQSEHRQTRKNHHETIEAWIKTSLENIQLQRERDDA
jgi:hypothetical protein